jgi:hypothetical protein
MRIPSVAHVLGPDLLRGAQPETAKGRVGFSRGGRQRGSAEAYFIPHTFDKIKTDFSQNQYSPILMAHKLPEKILGHLIALVASETVSYGSYCPKDSRPSDGSCPKDSRPSDGSLSER